MEPLIRSNEVIANQLVFALVLSSLILHATTPPLCYGVSILGLLGFGVSSVLAGVLLFSIFRNH
ncbi:MAG: hypothetical protein U9O87_09990 [Verrucomicrobiota bacterium]|nr:hypothetical protein [Verrucomicrobiota bacterium]